MKPTRRSRLTKRHLADAQGDYASLLPKANKVIDVVKEQLSSLLDEQDIFLGVPIEGRIKTLESVKEKMERKKTSNIDTIEDIIGIRIILLFKEDAEKVHQILSNKFELIQFEDTRNQLEEDRFGYGSNHYIIKMPKEWENVPSYNGLSGMKVEVQVRTLSQHIWAAASHKLQYKREASVPPPLRRSIFRLSAVLEMVDFELSRILSERENYVTRIDPNDKNEVLNVDNLARILREYWPIDNIDEEENYNDLLSEIGEKNIKTESQLNEFLESAKGYTLAHEAEYVQSMVPDFNDPDFDEERFDRGVYFTHVGLTRIALEHMFGEKK